MPELAGHGGVFCPRLLEQIAPRCEQDWSELLHFSALFIAACMRFWMETPAGPLSESASRASDRTLRTSSSVHIHMAPSAPNSAVPPLAFGDHSKATFSGLVEFADLLQQSGYVLLDLAAVGATAPLVVETGLVSLPSVTLLAISSSAHRVTTQRGGRVGLCFGIAGSGTLTAGSAVVAYHRYTGVLIPECPVVWRIDDRASDFEVSLDRERLAATARVMLGLDSAAPLPGWNLDDLRSVPARTGVVDGLSALIGLAIQADRYSTEPAVFAASGLEDQCYRQVVFLLIPEAFARPRMHPATIEAARPAINRLCEWIRANLHSPLALTDLERFSGLAARTLQVSFRKRFDMTPMAWLREQRLLAARTMLAHARGPDTKQSITAVAASCGFSSAAELRKRYRARFGDPPTEPPGTSPV
jgi:AraC-like DNA-binding protein